MNTLELLLQRNRPSANSTIGNLYVDGKFFSYTLEDVPRAVKVAGKTSIPAGIYKVIINLSNRFQRPMPLLLNVPDYEGVRIHSGNTAADTEGCILVGFTKSQDFIGQSRLAFDKLFEILSQAVADGKQINITIKDWNNG